MVAVTLELSGDTLIQLDQESILRHGVEPA